MPSPSLTAAGTVKAAISAAAVARRVIGVTTISLIIRTRGFGFGVEEVWCVVWVVHVGQSSKHRWGNIYIPVSQHPRLVQIISAWAVVTAARVARARVAVTSTCTNIVPLKAGGSQSVSRVAHGWDLLLSAKDLLEAAKTRVRLQGKA